MDGYTSGVEFSLKVDGIRISQGFASGPTPGPANKVRQSAADRVEGVADRTRRKDPSQIAVTTITEGYLEQFGDLFVSIFFAASLQRIDPSNEFRSHGGMRSQMHGLVSCLSFWKNSLGQP